MAAHLSMTATSLATRAAEAVATRLDRRNFLRRTTMVATALAAAPADFILRPITAYAAACGCSGSNCDCAATCCDGYTEFCCTFNGENTCPPGTLAAGWWKADGTAFCGGAARYYLDCNATCGSCGCGANGLCDGACTGTSCGCALGDCNRRKAGCTVFRYGQCHQEEPCLGPIVCRVVTCTPPWQLDASCTTTPRTDDFTGSHDAPCLHDDPFGALDSVRLVPGGVRVEGWAIDPSTTNPIDVHAYIGVTGFQLGPASTPRRDVANVYPSFGPNHGFDATIPWTNAGPVSICVYAINVGPAAPNTGLGCRTFDVGAPFGSFDFVAYGAGGLRVAGWAIDPDTSEPIDVHIYVNGAGFAIGEANVERLDVATAYPAYGANHGFDALVPYSGTGALSVCAYGINTGGAHSNSQLSCKTFQRMNTPFGSLDSVTNVKNGLRVTGWAVDPDTADPIEVHVYVNGTGYAVGTANSPRADVGAIYPSFGPDHGYDTVIPWTTVGRVTVCSYGINVGSPAANAQLGCVTMTANGG